MELTTAQKATLTTYISTEPLLAQYLIVGSENAHQVYLFLNSPSTFQVWRTTTPVSDIHDNISWANFTPTNPISGAGTDAANWMAQCGLKQMNLQNLLSGASFNGQINTKKPNIRAGFQDCLTNLPSGAAGVARSGGWPAVQLVIQRAATFAEKQFATGTGTTALPGDLTFEGDVPENIVGSLIWTDLGIRRF